MTHQNGVVEIAGRFAVNSDDWQIAIVTTLPKFGGRNDVFDRLSLFKNLRRKTVGEVEFADDYFDIHAEIVFMSENLDYTTARALGFGRPVGNFDVHHNTFQVIPRVGAPSCFFAENAILNFGGVAGLFLGGR